MFPRIGVITVFVRAIVVVVIVHVVGMWRYRLWWCRWRLLK